MFDRFSAVLFAFVRLAQRQFDSHRSLAVQWQADRTVAEILNFSQRFFFPFTPHNTEEGQEDPQDADARRARVIAMDKRIQEIRAEEKGSNSSRDSFALRPLGRTVESRFTISGPSLRPAPYPASQMLPEYSARIGIWRGIRAPRSSFHQYPAE